MKIRYIQPTENEDGFEEIIVTPEEAIRIQKETVSRVRPDFTYESDQQALDDYITVNWAEIIPG
jgi:hypothetical protein